MSPFIASAVLLAAAFISGRWAGGTVDNVAALAGIQGAAPTFADGQYKITNAQTGESLTFTTQGVGSIFPSSSGSALTLTKCSGGQYGDNLMSVSAGASSGPEHKCMAAQWNPDTDGGVDAAAVMYACDGTSATSTAKIYWMFHPISTSDSSSSSSSKSTSSASMSCPKSAAFVQRHPGYVTKYHHPGCAKYLKSSKVRRGALQKRSGTAYHIVPLDHANDMALRALASTKLSTSGGCVGTTLAGLDTSDASQTWYIEAA